ncbi:MAG: hypothetical protein H0X39_19240 [Actinobacteria bacterium]|nr:hypothetical protein [Actinomycetota bacterium]
MAEPAITGADDACGAATGVGGGGGGVVVAVGVVVVVPVVVVVVVVGVVGGGGAGAGATGPTAADVALVVRCLTVAETTTRIDVPTSAEPSVNEVCVARGTVVHDPDTQRCHA